MFGNFSLISDPSLHDGKEVCPGSSIKLFCEATYTTIDLLRWFVEPNATNLESSFRIIAAITVTGSTFFPKKWDLLFDVPGIEVYLTSFSQMNGILAYTSTLYVNTSSYNGREIQYISCGGFTKKSHWIKLKFTIKCKNVVIKSYIISVTLIRSNTTMNERQLA